MTGVSQQADSGPLQRWVGMFHGKLARAGAWLFAGTLAGGVLGYVYQVVMGRMLSPQEYGVFSAMMALFAVLSAPHGTLMMVVSRKVSEYRARHDAGSTAHFYRSVSTRTMLAATVLVIFALPVAPHIQASLKSHGIGSVYALAALLWVSFPPIVNDAFLQGLQRFSWFSFSSTLRILLKLVFSVALVALGLGVAGAVGGIVLASVAGWLAALVPLYRPLAEGRGRPYRTAHLALRPVVPVLIANTAFVAMTQLDMVLVNYFFPPHEAGLYAAASVLGKAVMYLPVGIATALFPMVAERHARDESSAALLIQAVALAATLCASGAVAYFLLGDWIIESFYGASYRDAGDVLRYFGFAMMPMGLVMVAEYFLIAKGRVLFAYLFAVIAPLEMIAIYLRHDSLLTVVAIMGVCGLLLAVVGYSMLWRTYRRG